MEELKNIKISIPTIEQLNRYNYVKDYVNFGHVTPITDFALVSLARYKMAKKIIFGYPFTYWNGVGSPKTTYFSFPYLCDEIIDYDGFSLGQVVRPIIEVDDFTWVEKNKYVTLDGVSAVNLGRYPQFFAPSTIQEELGELSRNVSSKALHYSMSTSYTSCGKSFNVFRYSGKSYVEVPVKLAGDDLIDGDNHSSNKTTWIEVMPVEWLIDTENHLLISKYGLIAGIPYFSDKSESSFKETYLASFLQDTLGEELFQEEKEFAKPELGINHDNCFNDRSIDEDFTFIKERLNLLKLANPESVQEIESIQTRIENISVKVKRR